MANLDNHPGWISNGELTGEYVRPPSNWDNEVERIAIYLYRAERGWAWDALSRRRSQGRRSRSTPPLPFRE